MLNRSDYAGARTIPAVAGDTYETDYCKFTSVSAFKRYLTEHVAGHAKAGTWLSEPTSEWCGRGWRQALEAMTLGDKTYAEKARSYHAKLASLLDWNSRKFERRDCVNGPVLNVSAYLTGAPRMMKRRERVEDVQAPLHVVVAVNSASACSQEALVERGCAVLALVQVLSAQRPVTLWLTAVGQGASRNAAVFVPVDTTPLSLAHAGFMLADQSCGRRMFFPARSCLTAAATSSWYPGVGTSDTPKNVGRRICQAVLGIADADLLYVPRPDGDDDIELDAAKWLTDNVLKYGGRDDNA